MDTTTTAPDLTAYPVKRRWAIFKTGTFVDGLGQTCTYSEQDLHDLAASYDARTRLFAPVVKGHPAQDDPALGGVTALSVEGETLFAEIACTKEIADEIDQLRWLGVSVALYLENNPRNPTPGRKYLRHVGLCGAEPPVVKGLGTLQQFQEAGCVQFAELTGSLVASPMETIVELLRRLRDNMIAANGLDAADRILPSWTLDYLGQRVQELRTLDDNDTDSVQFNEGNMTKEEEAQLRAQLEQATRDKAALQAQLRLQTQQAQQAEHQQFCERLVSEGRLLPAMKDHTLALLNHMASIDPRSDVEWGLHEQRFAENGQEQTRYQALRAQLASAPVQQLFAENGRRVGRAEVSTSGDDLLKRAAARAGG